MNKKFSTLMAGLLLAGGLTNFAYAEKLEASIGNEVKTVESGKTYFFIENIQSGGQYVPGYAYGVQQEKSGDYTQLCKAYNAEFTKEEMDNYLWEVTVIPYESVAGKITKFGYALKNKATQKYLTFANEDNDNQVEIVWGDAAAADKPNTFIAVSYSSTPYSEYDGDQLNSFWFNNNLVAAGYYLDLTGMGLTNISSPANDFSFYEVADAEVPSTDLNALYNSAGFNLKLGNDKVANAFDNGKTIKAVGVDPKKEDLVLTKDGYKYASNTFEGFPAGTYFLSETPAGKVPTDDKELYQYLLNSTFVAVSPSDNASTSATKQAKGEGFTLKEVAGKDLDLHLAVNELTSGTTVSVMNAAFTVMNKATDKDSYALSLARFRYNASSSAAQHTLGKVGLNILSDTSYGSTEQLVSDPAAGTTKYIFQFVESTIKKGSDLLNANGASVYNIKFVGGDVDGFYLTNAWHNNSKKNFAKGTILSDPTTPAFQYVITKVDGNDVTFTNRETGEDFTAKLFDKGNNKYTLALVSADQNIAYTILNVQNNGDIKAETSTEDLNLSEIELVPVTSVDKFAGFMDEANETRISLTFARDEDPTSNKLYPFVNDQNSFYYMTDDVTKGAVWQLEKSEKPKYETRTYAYIDADEKVAYKLEGDTVAYYTYKFQYVKDGVLKKLYMNNSNLGNSYLPNTGTDYIVKENVDGSVAILDEYNNNEYVSVNSHTAKAEANFLQKSAINQETNATDIKAYIVLDAPEVTLPTTASYITMKDEVGNLSLGIDNERDVVYAKDDVTIRVFATDKDKEIPSFFVTTGWNKEDGSRMFLMNPSDSVDYKVGAGKYDKNYQWNADMTKAIFKSAKLNASLDTLTTSITGKTTKVAMKADNAGVQGGLDYFKYQIFLADAEEADDLYIVRTLADAEGGRYLCQLNGKFGWSKDRDNAIKFRIADVDAPTANESINAANNVIVAGVDGAVVVKGAEGKNVIVSTILGKVVANEVVSSDNATIAAPAGIVVVSVDGESFKVVVK
mgnify:CR=1 FL=1